MPGIDGVTVIRKIRLDAALRGTPCLLLTASEDYGAELRALDAGADVFVRKEEDVEVILARLGAALRSARTQRGHSASLVGPKRVLAVDDSMTYLQELASVLRSEGYDVVLAKSGEEAIEMLAVQPVDCILLDLLMPGMDGKETCKVTVQGGQTISEGIGRFSMAAEQTSVRKERT
jgi:CheY-like chemotaxis protein